MRRMFPVRANHARLGVFAISAVTMLLAGCAAPSLSSRSFPALSWNGDEDQLTTGAIPRRNVTAPPHRNRPPMILEEPRRVRTNRNRSHLAPPRVVQRRQISRAEGQPLQQRRPADYNNPATFDPLPMYAGPDRKRNGYRWNGSHDRNLIDNRPPEAKLAMKSKVMVDRLGRRSVHVAHGDTMYGIARRHGLTTNELMAYNKMARPELRAGQILLLPANAR